MLECTCRARVERRVMNHCWELSILGLIIEEGDGCSGMNTSEDNIIDCYSSESSFSFFPAERWTKKTEEKRLVSRGREGGRLVGVGSRRRNFDFTLI